MWQSQPVISRSALLAIFFVVFCVQENILSLFFDKRLIYETEIIKVMFVILKYLQQFSDMMTTDREEKMSEKWKARGGGENDTNY